MNLRGIAIAQYVIAAVAAVLAVFVGYRSYVSWKFYSYTELAISHYDSASYGPAHKALSSFTTSYRSGDPLVIAFEANLLSLQGYHDKAATLLEESGLQAEGIIKLALAGEKLFGAEGPNADVAEEIALIEQAVDSYPYPDAMVSLGGAYLRSGELAKADTVLKDAATEAGKLTFDGLVALRINLGVLHLASKEYEPAAENFKKVIELLPKRKVPPLGGGREEARVSGQRGLVLSCVRWLTNETLKPREHKAAVEYVSSALKEKQATGRGPKSRWNFGDGRYLLLNALGLAQGKLQLYTEAGRSFAEAVNEVRRLRTKNRDYIKQAIILNSALLAAERIENTQIPESERKGQFNKAAESLAEAASQKALPAKQRYGAYNLSAKYYSQAQNKRKAVRVLKEAIDLMPDEATAVVNLAVYYDVRGKKDDALRYYEQALKLDSLKRRDAVEKRAAKLRE